MNDTIFNSLNQMNIIMMKIEMRGLDEMILKKKNT